jgi:SagB-type dehydrogenase family enzyme
MQLRTSSTLLIFTLPPDSGALAMIGIYDYVAKSFATCSINFLHWLSYFHTGRSLQQAIADHESISRTDVLSQISSLQEHGCLVEVGSDLQLMQADYCHRWNWGGIVAAFHYASLNNSFLTPDESTADQAERSLEHAQPNLTWRPREDAAIELPPVSESSALDHLLLLDQRRTNRTTNCYTLKLEELSACLFAAAGIPRFVTTPTGELPLTFSPSGGARNPYECYVVINRCETLAPGVYHYSGLTHEIEMISDLPNSYSTAELLAGQDWANGMSAVVFLVAYLERSMWKYQDSNAYRVVLIEAGHRAQNLMTTATALDLTVCPTAALAHDKVMDALRIEDKLLCTPLYALTIDKPVSNMDVHSPNFNLKSGMLRLFNKQPQLA